MNKKKESIAKRTGIVARVNPLPVPDAVANANATNNTNNTTNNTTDEESEESEDTEKAKGEPLPEFVKIGLVVLVCVVAALGLFAIGWLVYDQIMKSQNHPDDIEAQRRPMGRPIRPV